MRPDQRTLIRTGVAARDPPAGPRRANGRASQRRPSTIAIAAAAMAAARVPDTLKRNTGGPICAAYSRAGMPLFASSAAVLAEHGGEWALARR